MKKNILYIISAMSIVVFISGCGPELAKTKYGPAETQWKNYISKSYREWEPPATPPPMRNNGAMMIEEETIIELVPEPKQMEKTLPALDENSKDMQSVKVELPTTYKVQKGDSLWSIASKFYNNGRAWRAIQNANKDKLPTPDKLKAGMELTIPAPIK